MRDGPDGTDLLRHARALLLGALLPALPEDLRHQARLIAKALGIAAAEQTAGTGPLEAEADALAELYGEARTPAAREAEAVEETLLRLNWRLASEIRGAKRDGRGPNLCDRTGRHAGAPARGQPEAAGGRGPRLRRLRSWTH